MNIVPVRGKCVYRKDLIVQNWEHVSNKEVEDVTETYSKQIQIGMFEPLEIEFDISYPIPILF